MSGGRAAHEIYPAGCTSKIPESPYPSGTGGIGTRRGAPIKHDWECASTKTETGRSPLYKTL
jgi:hypothetical protein